MLASVEESSLADLTQAHLELYPQVANDLSALAPDVFFAPQGEHWSPAEHLDHLIRCVRPLASALRLPRFLLRLRFGRGDGSRATDRLVGEYLGHLEAGAKARGRYSPEPLAGEAPSAARQRQLLARFRRLGDDLGRALSRWTDNQLDHYRLPHPLLGRLTVREMLAWSLYHGRHHHRRILERLA